MNKKVCIELNDIFKQISEENKNYKFENEFLKQRNTELIDRLANKICENEILLEFKNILGLIIIECKCEYETKLKYFGEIVTLIDKYNIMMNIHNRKKGLYMS